MGEKVQDKLTVKETNGSLYTISVDVTGANDKVALVEGGEAKIDAAGKVTFTVADGDAGKLSLLIGADAETAKAYAATTVNDYFGNQTAHTDYGANVYAYTYDAAARTATPKPWPPCSMRVSLPVTPKSAPPYST